MHVQVCMYGYVTYVSVYGCVHVLLGRCLGIWVHILLPVSSM